MMDNLIQLMHSLPRFNFHFEPQPQALLAPSWPVYVEALLWWAAVVGCVGLLGLLIVVIVWSVHCCRKEGQSTKRAARVNKISTVLFMLSVLCFVWLGVCFFGNEQVNRGVTSLSHSVQDVLDDMSFAQSKLAVIRVDAVRNSSATIDAVQRLVEESGVQVNDTDLHDLQSSLRNLSDASTQIVREVAALNATVQQLHGLQPVHDMIERIEFERWICFAALFTIMLVVLFAAVIGFCRHSKKAAIIFSGIGMVVYILGYLLLALCFALSLGLADLCMDVRPVVDARISANASRHLAMFYFDCHADELPPSVREHITTMSTVIEGMQDVQMEAAQHINDMYAGDKEMGSLMTTERAIIVDVMRAVGVVESHLECRSMANIYSRMNTGSCDTAVGGMALLLLALVCFNITMFILLIVIGQAWRLYSHKSLDYVEVDEQDPFMPRQAASQGAPIDIYGSHVYNPRTRFASHEESGEQDDNNPLWSRSNQPPNTRNDTVYDHYS